jgi:hypothetical protein
MSQPSTVTWATFGLCLCFLLYPAASSAQYHPPDKQPDSACESQLLLTADGSGTPEEPSSDSGEVQERAVPRMGPGMSPSPQLEGGLFDGKRLRATPGFHLESQQGGTAMLRPNSGGAGVTLSCRCARGKGACIMTINGSEASCSPNGCSGDCEMRLTTGLKSHGITIQ